MARRVNQVELIRLSIVGLIGQADRACLDGDSLFPLQVHGVEHLILHVALGDGARDLQQPVGQGRLAVVNMGDYAKVADVTLIHSCPWVTFRFFEYNSQDENGNPAPEESGIATRRE